MDDEEQIYDIDDPAVPDAIRAHARRFQTPVRLVIALGNGEYVLSAADGEVVDLVVYK